jgi:hypothetical protein
VIQSKVSLKEDIKDNIIHETHRFIFIFSISKKEFCITYFHINQLLHRQLRKLYYIQIYPIVRPNNFTEFKTFVNIENYFHHVSCKFAFRATTPFRYLCTSQQQV